MQFRSREIEEDGGVNLTPLIDVVFLLLIFFMVSTTFDTTSQLKIELPEASAQKKARANEDRLIIMIDPQGYFYLNGQRLKNQSADLLLLEVHRLVGADKQKPVVVQSDAKSPVQSLVTAMDVIGRAGIVNLSVATTEPIE